MESINSFFRFVQMRKEGKTDEEILHEMTKDAEEDLARVVGKVSGIIGRSFTFRKEDGEDLTQEMDEALDITLPAHKRIQASKLTHLELQSKISEIEKSLIEMRGQMDLANKRKELLTRRLLSLKVQQQASSEEPKWMQPGTLEKLRAGGQEFGLACSRK